MIAETTVAVSEWMGQGGALAFAGSFFWGMVSVLLSPCHLASMPLLIAYVAGQKSIPPPRQAVRLALLFAGGIFITIIGIGLVCAAAGRMLGDIGPWWQGVVGIVLLGVAWTLVKPASCATTGSLLGRIQIQGGPGAFLLGLAYGFLAGGCTFGFVAPILGLISLQKEVATGVVMLIFFGLGHCLPLVLCGVFSARTMGVLHSHTGLRLVTVLRKVAALVIAGLGLYFLAGTFWS